MTLRLVLAILCICLAFVSAGTSLSASSARAAQSNANGYTLALRLKAGDRILQRSDLVDRITWILPRSRLEAFRAQGIVINEEFRTTILAAGTVVSSARGRVSVRGDVTTTVRDVPRGRVHESHDRGISQVTVRNAQPSTKLYAIEDAPMIDLPASAVELGSRWTTSQHVLTSLGSGTATFDHVVAAIEDDRVRVDVSGRGAITGKEYNLPHLLPGTMRLSGSAWFDLKSGLVVQESYRVQNQLVKPAGSERIGFSEVLDAQIDVHKVGH